MRGAERIEARVEPVSSVTAFVARYVRGGPPDPAAAEILAELSEAERLVVEAQALPARRRAEWLRERSGREWSGARLAYAEDQAFVRLRRALQRRGLLSR